MIACESGGGYGMNGTYMCMILYDRVWDDYGMCDGSVCVKDV